MLIERDYELLSAYIDGELNDSERAALETRLNSEDDLRRELATLRQTVALVNQLPKLKAPRNFTLEKSAVMPRTLPFPMTAAFSALSAAAAVLLLVFGGYLLAFSGSGTNLAAPQPSTMSQIAQAPTIIVTETGLALDQTVMASPTLRRDGIDGAQNQQDAQESAAEEPETALSDTLAYSSVTPPMTEARETGTTAQGSAGADQATESDFFSSIPAPTQLPPSVAMEAAPMMQQETESTDEEQNDIAANSAAGLALPASAPPTMTVTSLPTLVPTIDIDAQRAAVPTEAPLPPPQPTSVPQEKVNVQLDNGFIGVLSIIVGVVLLVVALATTFARRRRKIV